MTSRALRRAAGVSLMVAAGFGLMTTSAGAATFFDKAGSFAVPDNSVGQRYPATIEVSGLPGNVTNVRAGVGIQHGFPRDLDVLLVSPSGASSILISDVCGSTSIFIANLVLDDLGPLAFPESGGLGVGPCPDGTYRPLDLQPGPANDTFPPPAPPLPYTAALSNLNGSPINGTWKLFARDDAGGNSGVILNWTIEIAGGKCAGLTVTNDANLGTSGDDFMAGTPGDDVMLGLGGNDKIAGLGGNDVICGGDRSDTLNGGAGDDKLLGEAGKDKMVGGAGKDRFKGGSGKDTCRGDGGRDRAVGCEVGRSL